MIGQPQWFKRRTYAGWGLTPVTWQGWVYLAGGIGLVILIQSLPAEAVMKLYLTLTLVGVIVLDVLHIMATIKTDEREAKIEAISERNASWAMVTTLAGLLIYLAVTNPVLLGRDFMMYLIIPLFVGIAAKSISTFVLKQRDL